MDYGSHENQSKVQHQSKTRISILTLKIYKFNARHQIYDPYLLNIKEIGTFILI